MKYLLIVSSLFLLSSCGYVNRLTTHWTGSLTYKCSKHGVEYVQSDSGMTVSYNPDGTVVKCE